MTTRYAESHKNPAGPGDARPTAYQIVQDNDLVGKLSGKVALVTGVSSGIGVDTAKALKLAGMRVFGAVRDLEKGKQALQDELEDGKLELIQMDLNSLESVRVAAKDILSKTDTLNIVVNNAGIMMTPEGRTADGHELQFGTNHLAHFLLFQLLKDTLLKSATPEFASRVVSLSSVGHRGGPIHFENLKLEGIYDPVGSYAQAKLANIYFANEVDRRYGSRNLHAWSVMPGGIWSGLQQFLPKEVTDSWKEMPGMNAAMKSPAQGAATSIIAALDKELEGKGGKYLEDCAVAEQVKDGDSNLGDPGYAKYAYDEEAEKKLWSVSCELVGVTED